MTFQDKFVLAVVLLALVLANCAATSKLPRHGQIKLIGKDACIGLDLKSHQLRLYPCKSLKSSWSFPEAKSKSTSCNIRYIRNENLQGRERECVFPVRKEITEGSPFGQYNCLDAAAYWPKDIEFDITYVRGKGWKLRHRATKWYVRKMNGKKYKAAGAVGFVGTSKKPTYWEITGKV